MNLSSKTRASPLKKADDAGVTVNAMPPRSESDEEDPNGDEDDAARPFPFPVLSILSVRA